MKSLFLNLGETGFLVLVLAWGLILVAQLIHAVFARLWWTRAVFLLVPQITLLSVVALSHAPNLLPPGCTGDLVTALACPPEATGSTRAAQQMQAVGVTGIRLSATIGLFLSAWALYRDLGARKRAA